MKRKIGYVLTVFLVVLTAFCAVACKVGDGEAKVVSASETQVVIEVRETDGNATLLDIMNELQESEELSFSVVGGMVAEINGKANTADFSGCWMLYTSDTEMSNSEWGTVEYDGQTFASAILGVETLTVVEGGLYIWSYQSF